MDVKQKQIHSEEQILTLTALAESVARPGCKFLEVGSWCGDSTIILGKIAQKNGGRLFCVDWWKGNIGTDLESIAKKKDVFSLFWKNIRHEGLEDIVIPIRGQSDIAAEVLKEQTFDLIFLDGDHRFQATLNDIEAYSPLVRKQNGILCGHDCDGYISDFDGAFLNAGKEMDVYESVHCGVVLAVGTLFKNYSINYNIWSVQPSDIDQNWQATNIPFPVPKLIEKYKGFDLIGYNNIIYAIHNTLGLIDLTKNNKRLLSEFQKCGKCIISNSLDKARQTVEQAIGYVVPELIEENYNAFNIVLYRNKYYALMQSIGSIDFTQITKEELKKYEEGKKCFISNSLVEVKALVNQLIDSSATKIIEEGYNGFNIVLFGNKYHAVSQDLGEIDFTNSEELKLLRNNKRGKYFVKNSYYELKHYVDKTVFQSQREEIEFKNKEISILQKDILSKLLSKDAELNAVRSDLLSREQELKNTQDNLTARGNELRDVHADLKLREAELRNVHSLLASKGKELKETLSRLSSKDDELKIIKADLLSREQELKNTQDNLTARGNELRDIHADLKSREVELRNLHSLLASKEKELKETLSSLSSKADELKIIKANLLSREEELNHVLSHLNIKENEITRINSTLLGKVNIKLIGMGKK